MYMQEVVSKYGQVISTRRGNDKMTSAIDASMSDVAAFTREIGVALACSTSQSKAAAKTISAWTGANERTAKHWLAGHYAPNGYHLVALAHHSDEVLEAFLMLAGRRELLTAHRIRGARRKLKEAVAILTAVLDAGDPD
jgi:hypothetical protein